MRKSVLWMTALILVALIAACQSAGNDGSLEPTIVGGDLGGETATEDATLTPTLEPTASETPQPTSTATPRPTATATESVEPTETPSATPTVSAADEGGYAVIGVMPDDVLNVRDEPGVNGSVVGTIEPAAQNISVSEDGRDVSGSMWVPVEYGDVAGWVNSVYLAEQVGSVDNAIALRALEAVAAMATEDMSGFAELVHPEIGVRFAPYAYLSDSDQIWSAEQVADAFGSNQEYLWGTYDGSGEPIELTFEAYYEQFVYGVDYLFAETIGYDQSVSYGNMINNVDDVYPDGVFVEYHFDGFEEQYAGLDWRTLRIVLEQHEGTWYVVAVINDQWTT